MDNTDGIWRIWVAKVLGKEKATPEMNSIDGVWCDSNPLAKKLHQHSLNVGGHREEFEMPNAIVLPLHQAVSLSIGQVKLAVPKIKTRKSVNSDEYPHGSQRSSLNLYASRLLMSQNSMFAHQKYPDTLEMAKVVPLPKIKSLAQCKDVWPYLTFLSLWENHRTVLQEGISEASIA